MPASKPLRPGWVIPVVASLVALLAIAAGIAAWALLRPTAAPASSSAGTLTIQGGLTLNASLSVLNLDDLHCEGMDGYDDIRAGTSVTVADASGATIAVGKLGDGRLNGSGFTRTCGFVFTVADVPAGKGFYGIEVSHRGRMTYAEADVTNARSVQLQLG
jgi:hypothetical protein